ncbi:MAG: hypothetical protein HC905_07640 [Bacteroidales bacterium]|nr:hypothetical protein [Bacteroidales bacterium]
MAKSNIPVGKGLSSSSVDILGALISLNIYFDNPFHKKELYRLAATIDPTDACISPPLTVINQHRGEVIDVLPSLPYSLIWFDSEPEKQVNTVALTKNKKFTQQDYRLYNQLFNGLRLAIMNSNYADFLFWITQSSVYNERFLPKKNFNKLQEFAHLHSLGIFVAHSGTIMGLVMPSDKPEDEIASISLNFIKRNWDVNAHVECCQREGISFS